MAETRNLCCQGNDKATAGQDQGRKCAPDQGDGSTNPEDKIEDGNPPSTIGRYWNDQPVQEDPLAKPDAPHPAAGAEPAERKSLQGRKANCPTKAKKGGCR